MAIYEIQLKREPEKFIRKQSRKIQIQIISALRKLQKDPRPAQAKKLSGLDELYRIRAGDYRIVYAIREKRLLILVVRIVHHKDVYKNLP
jgi:mRNA interferase RelE/StbE